MYIVVAKLLIEANKQIIRHMATYWTSTVKCNIPSVQSLTASMFRVRPRCSSWYDRPTKTNDDTIHIAFESVYIISNQVLNHFNVF